VRDEHDLADDVQDADHDRAGEQRYEQEEHPRLFSAGLYAEKARAGLPLDYLLAALHLLLRFCCA